jgi:site-specific DNA-methyltransferase (adenine-specific)
MDYLNKIITGSCLRVIPKLPDNSIDLLITSIPYNSGHNYDVYKDNKPHRQYIKWLEKVFKAVYPKMKKGGRVIINVGDGQHGRIHTHVDVTEFMVHSLKYLHMSTIIWNKQNTSSRTSWGSFKSPSSPAMPCSFEYILVFAKESYDLQEKGETDITDEEFIDWSLALWTFPKKAYKDSIDILKNFHPASFPEILPHRLIKFFSWKNATVLDPFNGVGTTTLAAKRLGRNYIGIDISKKYCEYARNRLKYVLVSESLFNEDPPDVEAEIAL